MKRALAIGLLLTGLAAAKERPTYCNPLDIDYRYNFEQLNENVSYRSGADPVIVPHNGKYYLFVTISGGYWKSDDLTHWTYVKPNMWPFEDMCAPAALSVKGKLLLFQSTFQQRPIFELVDPDRGKLAIFNRWTPSMKGADGPWDPGLFHDPDTDRFYLYFGSSNVFPLYGMECDWKKKLAFIMPPVGLFKLHPEEHGWERFGQDHRETIAPFTEGAWMTKHKGKYYLQYGAPGTEYNVYATGTYVGDAPLGPFTYAPYNPVAYKPGGFACGIGHGNTFQDHAGRWWLTGTPWIGVNWGMERRIAMVPAGFDADGQMFGNTRFGDFPHYTDGTFTGWMLLSHKKPVVASAGETPELVADESLRTSWITPNRPGTTLTMDLGKSCDVRAIQVSYGDHKNNVFATTEKVYTDFQLLGSQDGKKWQLLADLSKWPRRDRACAYVPVAAQTRYVRYRHGHTAGPWLAMNGLRVFGRAPGAPPVAPQEVTSRRDTDPRNAFVSWTPVAGATGYNVRWGIAPNKLYQTYQVWADAPQPLEIRALNKGVDYYYAVEAFNETGVSGLTQGR